MAESDDEYDRKRRDKFRGERSAGGDNYRSERRDDRSRGRDDWQDRGRGRPDYRDYRNSVRDRYSPGREAPPIKRIRGDWDDRPRYGGHDPAYGGYGGWPHEHYAMHGAHTFGGHPGVGPIHAARGEPAVNPDVQTQPQMMTLKQFLATQDDSISDSEAITKYNEYKLDFKRQQLNEFFVAHKDEEWFKIKYHPEESLSRREEQLNYLKKRVEVFAELLGKGLVTNVSVDTTQTEQLLKLLDTVVIKLEDGTEEDLQILDEKPAEPKLTELKNGDSIDTLKDGEEENKDDPDVQEIIEIPVIKEEKVEKSNEEETAADIVMKDIEDSTINGEVLEENTDVENAKDAESEKSKKKRQRSQSRSSSSSSSSSGSDDEKNEEDIVESPKPTDIINDQDETEKENKVDDDLPKEETEIEDALPKNEDGSDDTKPLDTNEDGVINDESKNIIVEDDNNEEKGSKEENEKKELCEEDKPETIDLDKEKDKEDNSPRALHKTSSIFLRNLAPTITKAEVETMCKKYNGFLRVAIADPLGERRWFRRGWVTFRRNVNIKEICWNLNNIRLRDCELGAIVNRDLSRRVRPVNGITSHKIVVRSDIKLCAKIAHNLDEKSGLWRDDGTNTELLEKLLVVRSNETFGLNSKNPVLQNITDYLIEEASAEEDELLGISGTENKESTEGEPIERDPQLIIVLDKLILYLRIVHSVDFYNHCEYPYEDEMPNRCGIIHARGPPPQKATNQEIQDYIRNFENKMTSFLAKNTTLAEEELKKLGSKDCEAEVEKFVAANTQELSKDKWLCPLSGKKFKGPEFIRKHIFNKHSEKVDEVRKEVEYFNNYLKDVKRPQLPEHPGTNKKVNDIPTGFRPSYPPPGYAPPYAPYAPPTIVAPPRPRPGYPRRGLGGEYRPIIHYRDLDAPREPDEFI